MFNRIKFLLALDCQDRALGQIKVLARLRKIQRHKVQINQPQAITVMSTTTICPYQFNMGTGKLSIGRAGSACLS